MRLAQALAIAALGLVPLGEAGAQDTVENGVGAILRGIDKVNGTVTDIDIDIGAQTKFGFIEVRLNDCRYPAGDPSANAYAFVAISETRSEEVLFQGWMFASAPALNALDHPRYDIWVLRCKT